MSTPKQQSLDKFIAALDSVFPDNSSSKDQLSIRNDLETIAVHSSLKGRELLLLARVVERLRPAFSGHENSN